MCCGQKLCCLSSQTRGATERSPFSRFRIAAFGNVMLAHSGDCRVHMVVVQYSSNDVRMARMFEVAILRIEYGSQCPAHTHRVHWQTGY